MLRRLQDVPKFLELTYLGTDRLLRLFRRWLIPGGRIERLFVHAEELGKGAIFDCRMCGQCVLHSTGMTCPMTCPKTLRNGPCGGVRSDGNCEILPEEPCIWVQAWERSKQMPKYGADIMDIQHPHDNRVQDTSAWINDINPVHQTVPEGWNE